MAGFSYTRADLAARVLARLSEVGVGSAVASGAAFTASPHTQAQVIDRALARLGETGFDRATGVVAPTIDLTLNDLTVRAMIRLGEVGFGQTPEAEALVRMTELAPQVLAELVATRVYLPIQEPIPAEAFDALASVLASRASSDFGLGADEVALLAQRAQAAQDVLKRLIFDYKGRVTAILPGLLAELTNARTYLFPADDTIPAEAADALSDILAARAAQDFGIDAARIQVLAAEAEAGRRRLLALGLPLRVTNAIPAILAELYTDKVYAFPVDDQIRADAFDGLAAICSARLASDIAPDRAPILIQEAQMAEMRLRRMRSQPEPSRPMVVDYF